MQLAYGILIIATNGGGLIQKLIKRAFCLEPGFIHYGYNHMEQLLQQISPTIHWQITSEFLWDQVDQPFFLVQPNC
jgi:hypothetical protein